MEPVRALIVVLLLVMGLVKAQESYTVQPGDTLFSIARRYGTTPAQLAEINGITDPSKITAGQVLRLPADAPAFQRVPLMAPLEFIELPRDVVQGRAFLVKVAGAVEDASLQLRFLNTRHSMFLSPAEGIYQAILAVPALQPAGAYVLVVAYQGREERVNLRVSAGAYGRQQLTLSPATEALLKPEWVRSERERLVDACTTDNLQKRWNGPWKVPIPRPRITTFFGTRRSYNGGPFRSYHEGLDYGAPVGTPVYAPADGVVAIAEPLKVRGNSIVINHGMNVCSGYWHLAKIGVKAGQAVKAGELLGYVGTTGLSTGPHLHYEIRVQGIPVDPAPWYKSAP